MVSKLFFGQEAHFTIWLIPAGRKNDLSVSVVGSGSIGAGSFWLLSQFFTNTCLSRLTLAFEGLFRRLRRALASLATDILVDMILQHLSLRYFRSFELDNTLRMELVYVILPCIMTEINYEALCDTLNILYIHVKARKNIKVDTKDRYLIIIEMTI